jgi:hypothetical protein
MKKNKSKSNNLKKYFDSVYKDKKVIAAKKNLEVAKKLYKIAVENAKKKVKKKSKC